MKLSIKLSKASEGAQVNNFLNLKVSSCRSGAIFKIWSQQDLELLTNDRVQHCSIKKQLAQ